MLPQQTEQLTELPFSRTPFIAYSHCMVDGHAVADRPQAYTATDLEAYFADTNAVRPIMSRALGALGWTYGGYERPQP